MKHKNFKITLTTSLICALVLPSTAGAFTLMTDINTTTIDNLVLEENTSTTPDNLELISSSPDPIPNDSTDNTESTNSGISANVIIRAQNNVLFSGSVLVPTSTIIIDNQGNSHFTTSSNVLTALIATDEASDNFQISDLVYYDYYNSFYLNCLQKHNPAETLCSDANTGWNYVVDNTYPSIGMDSFTLRGGENIYIYFDNPWKISASTSTFPINTTTTFSTWRYDFSNFENEWLLDGNNIIEISTDNPHPSSSWDTTLTVTTTTSNASGTVDFLFTTTGTYYAKITAADWSKWSSPITLSITPEPILDTVTTTTTTTTTTNTNPNPTTGASSGSGATDTNNQISENTLHETAEKILQYFKSVQTETGQINDGPMSDWVAMSFGAHGEYSDNIKVNQNKSLYDFVREYNFSDSSIEMNACASYPRHILALIATGVGSNDIKISDLKDKILTECYQNNSYGWNGINDDIFALQALLAIEISNSNPIIQAIVETIKNDQQNNGAFTWSGYPGVDITGAAIATLQYAKTKGINVDDNIFSKAKSYLKENQLNDGGWGYDNVGPADILTTSWVIMGLNSLGETQNEWSINNNNPWSPLVNTLSSDGSYKMNSDQNTTDWFGIKHAVPALLQKTWPIIMPQKFFTVNIPDVAQNNGGLEKIVSVETSTNTIAFATTTSSTAPTFFHEDKISTTTAITTTPTTTPNINPESKNTTKPLPKKTKVKNQIIAGNKTTKPLVTRDITSSTTVSKTISPSPKINDKTQLPGIITPSVGLLATLSTLAWRKRRGVL